MNTRRPIRDSPEPIVLSVAFNNQCTRFVCGMENGLRVFRSKDCIRTQKDAPRPGHNIAIAEALDDRYVALVGGGRLPNSSPNTLEFWDLVSKNRMTELDMGEPIVAVRVTHRYLIIVLSHRTICLEYTKDAQNDTISPGKVKALYHTAENPYGLCCITGDTLALPGETPGQVQVLTLSSKDKKVFKVHESPLRQMALSQDGALIATASETGTIARIFSTSDPTKSTELRRGLESATIWGLAFSPTSQFLACTSDKGTLHIWDLRPTTSEETSSRPSQQTQRNKRNSVPRSPFDYDTLSHVSGSSTPIPSSVSAAAAGYMPPPPDLRHAPPSAAPSLTTMLSGLAKGSRSACSTTFSMGNDTPNWQGQPSHTSTTLPSGLTKKVRNENVAVPARPDGKPPKGVLCWDLENEGRLWVVGGGMDAQWEVFELVFEGRKVGIEKKGFRKYLTRQFPDKG